MADSHPTLFTLESGQSGLGFYTTQRDAAQAAGPVAVAISETLLGALVAVGTEHGSDLQLDQLLQAVAGQLGDQLTGRAAVQ